jgi:hypothetical protein
VILHTVGRGQEFVTEADDGLNGWTRQLIEDNAAEEPASRRASLLAPNAF